LIDSWVELKNNKKNRKDQIPINQMSNDEKKNKDKKIAIKRVGISFEKQNERTT
jgi:hypothetical protein